MTKRPTKAAKMIAACPTMLTTAIASRPGDDIPAYPESPDADSRLPAQGTAGTDNRTAALPQVGISIARRYALDWVQIIGSGAP